MVLAAFSSLAAPVAVVIGAWIASARRGGSTPLHTNDKADA